MNPFDLSGPQFLVFYVGIALIVVIVVKLAIDMGEGGAPPALPLGDPYQIAWLRGGTPEVARIAVLSLIDRGLLVVDLDDLVIPNPVRSFVLQPIENAILARCAGSRTAATDVLNDPAVQQACASYQAQLEQMQLTPDAGLQARRFNWFAFGAVILLGVALIKIAVAIDRARYNITFLVILTAIVLWPAWRLVSRRRTSLGDAAGRGFRSVCTTVDGFCRPAARLQKIRQLRRRLRIIMRVGLRRWRRGRLWRLRQRLSAVIGSGLAGDPNSLPESLHISTGSI
jgi:uncharacterized protein (TIGR04222 family)